MTLTRRLARLVCTKVVLTNFRQHRSFVASARSMSCYFVRNNFQASRTILLFSRQPQSRRALCSSVGDDENNRKTADGGGEGKAPKTVDLPISFRDGYFSICFGSTKCIFSYWTLVGTMLQTIIEQLHELNQSADGVQSSANVHWQQLKGHRIFALSMEHDDQEGEGATSSDDEDNNSSSSSNGEYDLKTKGKRYQLHSAMPIGYAFSTIEPNKIMLIGHSTDDPHDRVVFRFQFNANNYRDTVDKIAEWSRRNPTPFHVGRGPKKPVAVSKATAAGAASGAANNANVDNLLLAAGNFATQELLYLERERLAIKLKLDPLQTEFLRLVKIAKSEAHRRFKWGGLFLLSAQLGFVGRLTWFEYSWDIMEPVTWMLTYAMMVGTFAYYLITSEEYLVPMVEKRMIVASFWRLVRANNFDVRLYRALKDELNAVEKQIRKLQLAGV